MSHFNRLDDFFEGGFDPESEGEGEELEGLEPLTFNISFPEAPDQVRQNVKLVQGRLVVSFEFVFDDVDLLDSGEDD